MNKFLTILVVLLLAFSPAFGATFVVDRAVDTHDTDPGDGICADESGGCSFRAAIEESSALNGPDSILFAQGLDVIRVRLGSLSLEDDSTHIAGLSGYPTIDGGSNILGQALIELLSNSNEILGITWQRASADCLAIRGSGNRIGDGTSEGRNQFLHNGHGVNISAAIVLTGQGSRENLLKGNWIGVGGNGVDPYPNQNGVRLDNNCRDNQLDKNVISANIEHGIVISNGSGHNTIRSNLIGPDVSGAGGLGNGLDGIAIESGSIGNLIGDSSGQSGNLISLNGRHGISISASDSTIVAGNMIGVDRTGRVPAGNNSNGIHIADASRSTVVGGNHESAGNVVSSNGRTGIVLRGSGTNDNLVLGNHVGVDAQGIRYLGNGFGSLADGHGLLIDSGASHNQVGDERPELRNVISGNWRGGVWLAGLGTTDNKIRGNFIGVNVWGRSSIPNSVGVAITDGASSNYIGGSLPNERNILSGNRADIFPFGCGVLLSGGATSFNIIEGNIIGLDSTGTRALRNGSAGVIVGDGAHDNIIGGPSGNIISGNGTDSYTVGLARGVHLFGEGTSRNRIIGNMIGTNTSLDSGVENIGHGIGLFAGASHNIIGGEAAVDGNLIAHNDGDGVHLSGVSTRYNYVRYNQMYANDSLAICVRDSAQNGIRPPTLSAGGDQLVCGNGAIPGSMVDIYLATADLNGSGEGLELISSGPADQMGSFSLPVVGLTDSDSLVAMTIDASGNSSAFSNIIEYGHLTDIKEQHQLPLEFMVSTNYPNPFNPSTTIIVVLPQRSHVRLSIYNLLGRRVEIVVNEILATGRHYLTWNAGGSHGGTLASGLYLARVETDFGTSVVRMVLLK